MLDDSLRFALLAAADRAEELGLPLADHLRVIANGNGSTFQPFLTGSRRYGTPRGASDVDMVVLTSDAINTVLGFADTPFNGSTGTPRFGRLNIIALTPKNFEAWEEATSELAARSPVTRNEAIAAIQAAMKAKEQQPERQVA